MSNQKTLINQLARAELVDMVPYQSARRLFSSSSEEATGNIWLNANEAPGNGNYQLSADCINRYPDFQPDNLISAYSEYSKIAKGQLLATRGADEGIELVIKAFCRAYQDNILICPPTYGMYAISAKSQGVDVVEVPQVNNQLDMPSLADQVNKVKVVFICSPGNPTGNLLPVEQIKQTIKLFKDSAIVVIDEAYIEFSMQNTMQSLVTEFNNVVILRTLSKAFGLAGLRCGFTLANEAIITLLSKVIAPYPIAAPVAEIASSALDDIGISKMQDMVKQTNVLKNNMSNWLAEQAWCLKVFPSDANFILFQCEDKDAIFNALKAQRILIRDQSKQTQLNGCLRISIGNERELKLVKTILTEQFAQKTNKNI